MQRLDAINFSTVSARSSQRHSSWLHAAFKENDNRPYRFQVLGSAGVLMVRSFGMGEGARNQGHLAYRRFLDSCFVVVRDNKAICDVVVTARLCFSID